MNVMPEPTSGAPRRVVACLILLAIGTGCASVSPWNQGFVEVVTPNFRVTSSFGEAAARSLALELETLHAGTLYALGLPPDGRLPNRTRVVAFDDRGFGRPFAIRGEPASWIPSVDAPILMIRAPGSFAERVTADLRNRYARRVLRALSRERPPLWYAEGRGYLASTIRVSGTIAEIGNIPGSCWPDTPQPQVGSRRASERSAVTASFGRMPVTYTCQQHKVQQPYGVTAQLHIAVCQS